LAPARIAVLGLGNFRAGGDTGMMLKDKVAVVTGAARGIGREVALLMARHGARVLVNDLGGTADGTGGSATPADEVVNEIKGFGGEAAASYESVASMKGGAGIVQAALDHFGRVDVVVNNAGILRDRMIFNMTEEEWDGVIDTHLKGTFAVTRAASPHMREKKWGRIINMTSTSGLVGNVGQANYAAAKLGIVGFTKVVALDMARYNVTANCISPFAWTRMIGTIPTETEAQKARVEKIKRMGPEHIAPVAVFLASDAAKEISGQVLGVRGKEIMLFGHMRPQRSIHHHQGWTPERLAELFPGTLRHHLVPLETSGQYFNYDPLV
jgi:NAD(P)-dependent dehydrogenase (short-subunit alcohol dehydrogenase family)